MITNQVIQESIQELKSITKVDLYVLDMDGTSVAVTSDELLLENQVITGFAQSPADSQMVMGHHMLKILDEGDIQYILIAKGSSDDVYTIGKIAVAQLQNLIKAYKEKYDKNNFFQNLLLDNLLLIDVYNRAKKLRIEVEIPRTVFLIETKKDEDGDVVDLLKSLFSAQNGDYITAVDERSVILVKALKGIQSYPEVDKVASTIVDMISAEVMTSVTVSYGTIVGELKDVSKSYKEAKLALDVGKIFYAGKSVIAYNTLGIGRLIYQLPINLCKMFIREIFGEQIPEELDEETLITIQKFFENNLNVSETSRQLFVHRNTLVYRIEKLQKSTGLDIRVFDDALTFKIALMVVNYMDYLDSLNKG